MTSWDPVGLAAPEEAAEEAAGLLGLRVPGAALPRGHVAHDGVDVLAAAGPGGLAAGLAGDCSAHEGGAPSGVGRIGWVGATTTGRSRRRARASGRRRRPGRSR